jgi:hypothetical protein
MDGRSNEVEGMAHAEDGQQEQAGTVTRADIDQLDEALEIANRVLRANSLAADRVYAVYNRSLADLIAGRRTAAAGSFSVLQAAQAELG